MDIDLRADPYGSFWRLPLQPCWAKYFRNVEVDTDPAQRAYSVQFNLSLHFLNDLFVPCQRKFLHILSSSFLCQLGSLQVKRVNSLECMEECSILLLALPKRNRGKLCHLF